MNERVDPAKAVPFVAQTELKEGPRVAGAIGQPKADARDGGQPGPDAPVGGKPKRRWLTRTLLAGACVAALMGGGYYSYEYWTNGRFLISTDDAYLQADAVVVAPKVGGSLKEVNVADNEKVKAGDVLARIDGRDLATALHQAQANETSVEADLQNVEALLQQQQANIDEAKASVLLDNANLKFASEEYDRYVALARSGSGSVQNAQQAVSKLGVAHATLEKDTAVAAAAEKQVGVLQAQQKKAQAAVGVAQAQVQQAELNLSYATIVAPIDGVVGNRTLRAGEYVQAGTSLMSIVPLNAVYVVANYKETQLTDVRPGERVEVEVDTFSNTIVPGIVDSIAPASGQEFALLPPDNATGNFTKIVQRVPVKIALSTPPSLEGLLRPGMSVTPTIDVRTRNPREAALPVRTDSN